MIRKKLIDKKVKNGKTKKQNPSFSYNKGMTGFYVGYRYGKRKDDKEERTNSKPRKRIKNI